MIINIKNCTASVINDIKYALPRCKIEYEKGKQYNDYNVQICGISYFETNDEIASLKSIYYEELDIWTAEFYKIEII